MHTSTISLSNFNGKFEGKCWLAVKYAPDLCHSILYFFFKPRSAYYIITDQH